MFEILCGLLFNKGHYYTKCIEVLEDISRKGRIFATRDRDKRYVLSRLKDNCILVRKRAYAGSTSYVINKAFIDQLRSEITLLEGAEWKVDSYCLDQFIERKRSGAKKHEFKERYDPRAWEKTRIEKLDEDEEEVEELGSEYEEDYGDWGEEE